MITWIKSKRRNYNIDGYKGQKGFLPFQKNQEEEWGEGHHLDEKEMEDESRFSDMSNESLLFFFVF